MTEKPSKSQSLAVAGEQETWTAAQVRALRAAGFDCPKPTLDLLFHVAKTSGLDPFREQLYVTRNERDEWQVRTRIGGLLAAARDAVARHGESLAISAPQWAREDGTWTDLWVGPGQPAAARVTVHRAGQPFTGVALYAESVVLDDETGRPNRTWQRRGASQLAKVAKAAALRDACPVELSGLYTDDEFRGDTVPGALVDATVTEPGQRSHLDDLLDED